MNQMYLYVDLYYGAV